MPRNPLPALLLVLGLSTAAAAPAADTAAPADRADIRITSDKPVPINPKIYGINCAEMFIFDLVQKPEYLVGARRIAIEHVLPTPAAPRITTIPRARAASTSVRKKWPNRNTEPNTGPTRSGSPDFFQQYVGFMKPMGGHAVFIPNIFKGTVEELDIYLKNDDRGPCPGRGRRAGHGGATRAVQLQGQRRLHPGDQALHRVPQEELSERAHRRMEYAGRPTRGGPRFIPAMEQGRRQSTRHRRLRAIRLDGVRRRGAARPPRRGEQAILRSSTSRTTMPSSRAFPQSRSRSTRRTGGPTKRCSCCQWGTHADRNLVVEGLHMANFYFFMTQYNATHDNYFEVATWSAPMMQDLASGKRKNSGGGCSTRKPSRCGRPICTPSRSAISIAATRSSSTPRSRASRRTARWTSSRSLRRGAGRQEVSLHPQPRAGRRDRRDHG